ncbi:RNA-binding motif, single-stranded-interacting protein 1 [Lemmus lemmus]
MGGGAAAAAAAEAAAAASGKGEAGERSGLGNPKVSATLHSRLPSSFMGKVWKQQMYPQYATYYYPQYLQAKGLALRAVTLGSPGVARSTPPPRPAGLPSSSRARD